MDLSAALKEFCTCSKYGATEILNLVRANEERVPSNCAMRTKVHFHLTINATVLQSA